MLTKVTGDNSRLFKQDKWATRERGPGRSTAVKRLNKSGVENISRVTFTCVTLVNCTWTSKPAIAKLQCHRRVVGVNLGYTSS